MDTLVILHSFFSMTYTVEAFEKEITLLFHLGNPVVRVGVNVLNNFPSFG